MKCIDCQGTGLENPNKLCQNCGGSGEVLDEILEGLVTGPEEGLLSEEKVARTSVVSKVKSKVASIKKAIKK